jgi:hypothetical protein
MLIFDLVDPVELTGAARATYREVPDESQFTLNQLLPDVEVQDVEYRVAAASVTHGEAAFRAFDTPTPIGRRQATLTTTVGLFPPVGQKLVVGEFERVMLQRAQGSTVDTLVRQSYLDTHSNVIAIRTRMERARAQVLTTGKFTLTDENGLTLTADFGVAADHLNVAPAGALWTDVNADLFGDLEAWFTKYQDDDEFGELPGAITTSRRVVNLARKNKQIVRAVFGPLATEGHVTQEQLRTVLIDEGFPPFRTYETKVGGQRLIADDKVILSPSDPASLGETQFGITADALELVNSNVVEFALHDAPGITAVQLKNGDPAQIYNKATAGAIPVLTRPNRLFVADVA